MANRIMITFMEAEGGVDILEFPIDVPEGLSQGQAICFVVGAITRELWGGFAHKALAAISYGDQRKKG